MMKGLCNKHYIRLRRHGTLETARTSKGEPRAFIDSMMNGDTDECVFWPFSTDANGYAKIRYDSENHLVHRVVCIEVNGPPPDIETQATHTCGKGNLGCINKNHLEWGTGFKNQQDRVEHGTSNRGERCAAHKLTADQAMGIFMRLSSGERPHLLAREYGVHDVTILDIKLGRSWAWLTGLQNPKERDRMGKLIVANDNLPAEQRRVD